MSTAIASASFRRSRRPAVVIVALVAGIAIVGLVSLNLGLIRLAPSEVLRTLVGQGTAESELILYDIRLPRLVLAVLIGVGLATSGTILQGVTRNGLADPGIIGINACAGLGVFALLAYLSVTSGDGSYFAEPFALPLVALLGGLAGAALVYVFAYRGGSVTPSRLLLVGVAISFGASACIPLLVRAIRNPGLYQYAVSWLEGNLSGANWDFVAALVPWVIVLVPFAAYRSQTLNLLDLRDVPATGLGVRVERQRLVLLAAAVGLAAASVAVGGGVAFIGLLGPHLGRRLVGLNHRILLPVAALSGALLMVFATLLARNLLAPFEIPVGIVVAVIGAPYFLFLLMRTPG